MDPKELSEFARDMIGLQSKVKHLTKNIQGYGYKYADLTQTLDALLNELASDWGFAIMQLGVIVEGKQALKTILLHKSGISFAGDILLNGDTVSRGQDKNGVPNVPAINDPQEFGSWWTYARRYSLQGAFGLTAKDDDGANQNKQKPKTQRPPGPKPNDLGSFVCDFGSKFNGKSLRDIPPAKLNSYIKWLEGDSKKKGKALTGPALELCTFGNEYLNTMRAAPAIRDAPPIPTDDGVPF